MKAKSIGYLAAIIIATALAANAGLAPNASEVVKLVKSGVSEDVATAYVRNVSSPFHLSADDILDLKGQGVSSQVIAAMLNHDTQMRGPAQTYMPPPRSSHPRSIRRSSHPRSMINPRRRPTTHRRWSRQALAPTTTGALGTGETTESGSADAGYTAGWGWAGAGLGAMVGAAMGGAVTDADTTAATGAGLAPIGVELAATVAGLAATGVESVATLADSAGATLADSAGATLADSAGGMAADTDKRPRPGPRGSRWALHRAGHLNGCCLIRGLPGGFAQRRGHVPGCATRNTGGFPSQSRRPQHV